jgi:hypothetical protein
MYTFSVLTQRPIPECGVKGHVGLEGRLLRPGLHRLRSARLNSFQHRIQELVAVLTGRKEEHTREANELQSHIDKLNLLAETDDPEVGELILKAILPPAEPAGPAAAFTLNKLPVRRINTTRDGLFALTEKFDGPFTVNALAEIVADNQAVTDADEKKKLRGAVFTMMRKLVDQGRLIQVEKGKGKKQGTFQRRVAASDHQERHRTTEAPEHVENAATASGTS